MSRFYDDSDVRLDANNSGPVNGAEWASPRARSSWDCAETDLTLWSRYVRIYGPGDLVDRIIPWGGGPQVT